MVQMEAEIDPVTLSSWPTCLDCISCSSDGDLAVAGGEFVHLLTPKQPAKDRSTKDPKSNRIGHPHFDITTIRINVFSKSEWPNQTTAPFADASIGEEQSQCTVSALSWSPPGLGVHRRSVLAILTSNLILSLWESIEWDRTSTGTVAKWDRTCIVNHVLPGHFDTETEEKHSYRRKVRIRSFTWAPPITSTLFAGETNFKSKWGGHFLLVANDADEIMVLEAQRESYGFGSEWRIRVAAKTNILPQNHLSTYMESNSLFHEAMTTRGHVKQLSMGPWLTAEGQIGVISSAFITLQGTKLGLFHIRVSLQTDVAPDSPITSLVNCEVYLEHSSFALDKTNVSKEEISYIGTWDASVSPSNSVQMCG